jgi:hypothetical protein
MVTELLKQPFFQVALPLMATFMLAAWYHARGLEKRLEDFRADVNLRFNEMNDSMNRRFEAVDRRFDAWDRRFDRLETLLTDHDRRITRVEERTSPLTRP